MKTQERKNFQNFISRTYLNLKKVGGNKKFQEYYMIKTNILLIKDFIISEYYETETKNEIIFNLFNGNNELISKNMNVSEIPSFLSNCNFSNIFFISIFINRKENKYSVVRSYEIHSDFEEQINNIRKQLIKEGDKYYISFINNKNEYFMSIDLKNEFTDIKKNLKTKLSYSQILNFSTNSIKSFKFYYKNKETRDLYIDNGIENFNNIFKKAD